MLKSLKKINLNIPKGSWHFPGLSDLLFLVSFLVLSYTYDFQHILTLRPQSIHQWRQADCLSFTLNYYQDGNPFIKPAMHNLADDGTGKTASDFPAIYFLVAQLWKVFGYHEYIFRLVTLLISFLGLFALFKTLEPVLKDTLWALMLVVLLYTSPFLIYYSFSFLTNVPAFSFALMAWFFFYKFYKSRNYKYFYLTTLMFLIAGLLKVPALLSFIAICAAFALEFTGITRFGNQQKLFPSFLKTSIPILIVLTIIVLWYFYAYSYNKTYNRGYFLIGTLPIWELDGEQIRNTFLAIKAHLKYDYFSRETSYILAGMWVLIFVFYRKGNKCLLTITGLISIGMIAFFLLFFQALNYHDYYTTNLLILIPFILLSFLTLLKKWNLKVYSSWISKAIVFVFLIHNIGFARDRISERYSKVSSKNETRTKYTYGLETIDPYLQSIGVKKNDKVICLSDHSINISLYLMNRKGWTWYNVRDKETGMQKSIDLGAKYMIEYKGKEIDSLIFSKFVDKKIGQYKNISIYSIVQPVQIKD